MLRCLRARQDVVCCLVVHLRDYTILLLALRVYYASDVTRYYAFC